MKQCPKCQQYNEDYSQFCSHCGYNFQTQSGGSVPPPVNGAYRGNDNAFDACGPEGKSRGVAALLAILIGSLGVQYFYLGKTGAGLITIGLSLITCGFWSVVTLIQGILMLCMTNETFRQTYVETTSTFPLF